MPDRNASRTALGTAYVRAAHQLLDGAPRILDDPVALILLGASAAQQIKDHAEEYQTPALRGLRSHVVLRSRFAEDRLAASVGRGITQYVILGAGFDTFALRQPAWAQALRILEIDHEGTQSAKRKRLLSSGLSLPKNVELGTVDFGAESLRDGLSRLHISADEPTFFSWLGVTMYLEETAISSVLKSVASFPSGTEIVLTFTSPKGETPSPFDRGAASVGEPWISYFEPEAVEELLLSSGFTTVEFLLPDIAAARYFRDRPRDLPLPKRKNIVSAIV